MATTGGMNEILPLIAPDLAEKQINNQLRQMYAQKMMQQQSPQGGMVGQVYVGPSWTQGLASMTGNLLGAMMTKDALKTDQDINREAFSRMAGGLGGDQPAAPAQPTDSPVDGQAPAAQPAPVGIGGNANFSTQNLLRGRIASLLGGDAAGSAYWDQFKPTDLQKNDRYLGIDPTQSRAMEVGKRTKEGALSVPDNGYMVLPDGRIMWGSDIKGGTVTLTGPNGMPVSVAIPGSNENAAARAGAIKRAELGATDQFATPSTMPLPGGPRAVTPAQQRALANGGVDPATGYQVPVAGASPEDAAAVQRYNAWKAAGGQGEYRDTQGAPGAPGFALESPGEQAVNAEKGKAAINAASIESAAAPLLQVINQARQINKNVPYGPFGMAEGKAVLSQFPGMDHTNATNAALWDQMVGQSILNTISSLASSGGIRMDIPIVKEIQKAGGIPMSLPPEARAKMLDQLESEIRSRIAASKNVVPALNQPGITTNTQTSPMAGSTAPMSLNDYLKSKGY